MSTSNVFIANPKHCSWHKINTKLTQNTQEKHLD